VISFEYSQHEQSETIENPTSYEGEGEYQEEQLITFGPTIQVQLRDSLGDVDVQYPGKSFLITIPLSAPFMRHPDGELRFNAVEYICRDNIERGILPRSFVAGDNLYIYANRTGSFRLVKIECVQDSDMGGFLRIRGISPTTRNIGGQSIVTRGGFWSALMDIHWVENLFHDPPPPHRPQFPDLDIHSDLNRQIWVGQSLDAFYLVGYQDGYFRANNPLRRDYMFKMLAGYINAFNVEVDGLMPLDTGVMLPENFNEHWSFSSYEFLRGVGFIPYDPNNNVSIDLGAYVTLDEVQRILFKLITSVHFNQ